MAMSVCDLLTNILALPSDIFEICFHYDFDNVGACKFFGFVTNFLSLLGGSILVAVALDRFRTICQPAKKQKSPKRLLVEIFLCGVFAVCTGAPFTVLKGVQTVSVENTNVTGVTCSIDNAYIESSFFVIYNLITGVAFIICVTVLCVSYGLIGWHVWRHRKKEKLAKRCWENRRRNARPENEMSSPVGTSQSNDIGTSQGTRQYTVLDDEADNGKGAVRVDVRDPTNDPRTFSNSRLRFTNQSWNDGGLVHTDKLKINELAAAPPIVGPEESCFSSSSQLDDGAEVESGNQQDAEHFADASDIDESDLDQSNTSACIDPVEDPAGTSSQTDPRTGNKLQTITGELPADSSHPVEPKTRFKPELNKTKSLATRMESRRKMCHSSKKIQRRTTLMMLVLTAMFILSYLPYIVMAALHRGKRGRRVRGVAWV